MTSPHSAPSDAPSSGGAARTGRAPVGEYLFAGICAALGVYTLVGAGFIRVPPGSSNVLGPRAFPYLVGAVLLAASVAVIVQVARGRLGVPEEGEDVDESVRTDWLTVVKVSAFFLSQVVLIDLIGWPLAVVVVFGGAAWSLGAKRWWKALLVGLVIGVVTQLVFGSWLGLSLPAGPLLNGIPISHG